LTLSTEVIEMPALGGIGVEVGVEVEVGGMGVEVGVSVGV
jgi:hypothetical protein